MDTFLVHSALQGVHGAQWKLLGINLSIPWNKLDAIESEGSFPGDIEEIIRLWMSQEPTWQKLSVKISQEHSKYLRIITTVCISQSVNFIFLNCIYRRASTRENPRKQFILSVLTRSFSNHLLPSLALDGDVLLFSSPSLLKTL